MLEKEINEIMREQEQIMAIFKKDGYIINDHNSGTEKMPLRNWAVVRLYEYDRDSLEVSAVELCPVAMFSFVTCLNPLYIGKDGHVHLSTWSVGGNLWNLDIDRYNREFSPSNKDGWHSYQKVELVFDPEEGVA